MTAVTHRVSIAGIPLTVHAPACLVLWAARIVSTLPRRDEDPRDAASESGQSGVAASSAGGLTLTVLDSTHEPMPVREPGARATLFHYDTFLYPCPGGVWHLERTQGGGATVDAASSQVRVWVPEGSPDAAEDWFSVTVMVALALALRTRDRFHVHAALVQAADGRWWGIAGESGSGKTTLTLSLLAASGAWASDDALFLASTQPGEAWGWPRDFHVSKTTLGMFPQYQASAAGSPPTLAGKFRVAVGQARGAVEAVPIAGWLFPWVSAEAVTGATPLTGAGAFGRLLTASAWAAFPELGGHIAHLEALRNAANFGKAWEVALGADMLLDSSAGARLVERLPSSP